MQDAYKHGKDLYAIMGSKVYGVPYEDCREFYPDGTVNPEGKERRTTMKSVLLGIMYERGAAAIGEQFDKSAQWAQKLIDDFYKSFPKVAQLRLKIEKMAEEYDMRRRFLMLINQEIRNRKAGKPAYIRVKVNHVTDPVIIAKLYEASQAGVPITLLVRGNCSLVTGIPGVSDNIRACGIIDRYLEHARIFIFAAGGEEKIYIGSADWMPRNLDNRIEVIAPVHNPVIREEMKRIVDAGLQDNRQGRIVDGSGENLPWPGAGDTPFRSQEALYEHYKALEENGEETRNDR